MELTGILNLNKPPGVTSRRVVDVVQRLVRPAKAGHAGTLDPLATGVLIVCVGKATRLISYVQQMPKRYVGSFLLGRTSTTEDVEGDVTLLDDAPEPSLESLHDAAATLIGVIEQRPPAFSALKVAGRRAYELAREGKPPELAPRLTTIHSIDILEYGYPTLTIEVSCGSGTYIRTLGRDLARQVGSDAVMSALTRTAIGSFRLEDAQSPDSLAKTSVAANLLPLARAVESLTSFVATVDEERRIVTGLAIERSLDTTGNEVVALRTSGDLLAILESRGADRWHPSRVFHPKVHTKE